MAAQTAPVSADLGLNVAVDVPAPNENDVVNFTVTIANNGPDNATGVQVTDLLPAGLTFVNATPSQGSYDNASGSWTLGSVANGASVTLTVRATVNAGTGGSTLVDGASITASDVADPVAANDSATRSVAVQTADLAVAMTVNNATPNEDNNVTFTITLTNTGPNTATGVLVTDLLPSTLSYQSSTPSQGSYSAGTGVWTVGSLANGASVTLLLVAKVAKNTNGRILVNTARITTATQADHVADNNAASVSLAIQGTDLALTMTVDNAISNEGNTVTFNLTLFNNGSNNGSGVRVTDLLPSGFTYVSSTSSRGSYSGGLWNVGNLGNGSGATLALRGSLNTGTGGTVIRNSAAISNLNEIDLVAANDTTGQTVTVQLADLGVGMALDNPAPNEGSVVTYTITVTNNGPDPTTTTTVTDVLPTGLTYQSSSATVGSYASGSGIWTVGALAAGASATLTLSAKVNAGTGGTIRINGAIASADQADHVSANDLASRTLLVQSADLAVTLTVDNANPDEGGALLYSLTVTNRGPDAAAGISVTEALPAGLGFVSATPSQGSYASGTGVWTLGSLATGATATLTLAATVNAGTGGSTILGTGTITASDHRDLVAANNSATTSIVVQSANLGLAMSVDNASPNEGGTITFTATLTNSGPNAAGAIAVADVVPSGFLFVSATASQGSYASGNGAWTVGSLANGASATLALTVTVSAGTGGTIVTNTATTIASDHRDPVAGNNSASKPVTVQLADLGLAVTVDNPVPNEGNTITFTIKLTNNGPNAASGVGVLDLLPPGLTYVSATAGQGNYASVTGVWTVGSVATGASATLTLRATVTVGTGGTTLVDSARVSVSGQADHAPANNAAGRAVSVRLADLGLVMAVDNATPNEGNVVAYTITLTNHGPDGATSAVVADLLPSTLTFVSATPSQGNYVSSTGAWTVGSLANAGSATLTLRGVVKVGSGGATIANTAAISSASQADHTVANNSATAPLTVQLADLGVALAVDDARPNEGNTVTYTVTLTNAGPNSASGISVLDKLPAGITYVSATPSQGSYASGSGAWTTGNLANAATATLVLRGTVNTGTGGTTITSTAQVTAAAQADHAASNNLANLPVTIPLANLGVTVAVDNATPNEGAVITYTITVTNSGPDAASAVVVSDMLPATLGFLGSIPSQGTYAGGSGAWIVGGLANGASATLALRATVNAGTGGGSIINTASVASVAEADHVTANNSVGKTVTVPLADLAVALAVSNAFPNEGSALNYTITLTNNGASNATGVVVVDAVPAGLTYVSATPSQGSYASGTGVWTVGSVINGAQPTLTLNAVVDAGVGGTSIVDGARVSASDQADHVAANNIASNSLTVQTADLALALSVDNPAPNEGVTVTYTLTLNDLGPDAATSIAVSAPVPAGMTFVSAAATQGSYASGSGAWNAGNLANGAAATLTLRARVNAGTGGTTLPATATLTAADQADHAAANNLTSGEVAVPLADLAVAMAVDTTILNEGGTATFTVTLANAGPNDASGITLTDLLPAGLSYTNSTPSQGSYVPATGLWTVGSVANGATATLVLRAGVDPGTGGSSVANTASVTGASEADHAAANNTVTRQVAVTLTDLEVSIAVDDATPNQGSTVMYIITLENHGPDGATGVSVTHVLPVELAFLNATPTQGSFASGTGLWSVGSLASNATASLNVSAVVNPGTGGRTLTDSALVRAEDQADHIAANNSAAAVLTVQSADLGLALFADHPTANEGAPVTLTLTLVNHGPFAAGGITVAVPLPVGLDYASAVASQGSYANAVGMWTVGSVANADSATLTLSATVGAGTGGTALLQNATISASDHLDWVAANNQASVSLGVPLADVALTLAVDDALPNEGGTLVYTLVVTNHGPSAATGIAVTNALPPGLSYAGAAPNQGAFQTGTGVWTLGGLANDATATLVFHASVGAGTGGVRLADSVRVSAADAADHTTANNLASAIVQVQTADVGLAMAVNDANPNEGEALTYTLTLTNHGPDAASGITVNDVLPAQLSYVSSSSSQGSYAAGGAWIVGSVAAGASATLSLTARVGAGSGGTTIAHAARVGAADQADHVAANDSTQVTVLVRLADLELALVSDHALPNEGDTLGYTLTLTNHGPDPASRTVVTDLLPAGLSYLSASANRGGYSSSDGLWSIDSLTTGSTATLLLRATVDAGTGGTAFTDSARVTAADQADHLVANNAAAQTATVQLADLGVSLAVDNAAPDEGSSVTFTTTLNNNGPNGANGIGVADALPAGLSFVSASATRGNYASANRLWSIDTLASGDSVTLAIVATVDGGTGGRSLIDSVSLVAAHQADHNSLNNTARRAVGVRSADVGLTMAISDTVPIEGETVALMLTLTDHGPDAVTGIAVMATLPTGLHFRNANASQGLYLSGTGLWNAGALAVGASATLAINATVDAGTGGTTLLSDARVSAADRPDPVPGNNHVSTAADVRLSTFLTATARSVTAMFVGAPAQEVWRMSLRNPSAVPETLTSLRITNAAAGPGTQSQRDAEWTALALVASAAGVPRDSGSASFSGGAATFTNLAAVIPARDSLEVVLRAGGAAGARVGDTLDLRLASPNDCGFAPPVNLRASWPVEPAGAFVIQGMIASQIDVRPSGPGTLNAGLSRQLALEARLPANGYEPDQLQRVEVINLGSAVNGGDITKVEAWADDGDGRFSATTDQRLGTLVFTGSRWEITGHSVAVPVNGVRLFWTVDLAAQATEGRTVRLAIPAAPDVGIGMASGDSGPLDRDVEEPWGFTISSLDRVTVAAAPLNSRIARPGDRALPLLQLVATNSYATDRTLSDVVITNTTRGSGTPAELDGEIRTLTLREDANDDAVLSGTDVDPILGTGFFSGGSANFSGLRWRIPAGRTRQLFVTADASPMTAADGDSLDVSVSGALSMAFIEATAVTGGWPLDSSGPVTIDGFAAAQVLCARTPSLTVAPNDAGLLALDFIVPADGYRPDDLHGMRVVNLGTAGVPELQAMKLWRDGGDGVYSAGSGDDILLGAMSPQGGGWQAPPLGATIGPAGLHCFISVDVAGSPTESTTVRLAIPIDGIDNASANDGPVDTAVASVDGLLISSAPLLASLLTAPSTSLGQVVAVRMVVRNTGTETVNAIAPSTLGVTGTGALTAVSGPSPAAFSLAPAAVDTFVWQYSATTVGAARFTGRAAGTGAVSGLPRASSYASSGPQQVFVGTSLLTMTAVQTMPVNVNRSQTGVVPFSLTLTNQGGSGASDARLQRLQLRLESPDGGGIVPSRLLTRVEVNEGTNLYLVKTSLESSGSDIDLTLDSPVLVSATQPTTLTLRLDIAPGTTVPGFLVSIIDNSWLTATDATSGTPVTVTVVPGGYPLRSGAAHVVAQALGIAVDTAGTMAPRVARGSRDVPIMTVRLDNPGITGISSDARVYSLGLSLLDSAGVAIADPTSRLKQVHARVESQVIATHVVASGVGSTIVLQFSPPLNIPANSPLEVMLEGDLADSVGVGRFAARLADSTTLEARDATTRTAIPAHYVRDPMDGGWVTIESPADSLVAGGIPLLPASLLIGSADVPAVSIMLRHPGLRGTARIRLDSLHVEFRDELRRPLAPANYFSRLELSWNGIVVASTTVVPAAGAVTFALPPLQIEPADSDTVTVSVDVSPAAPAGSIELLVHAAGIMSVDVNTGRAVRVGAALGSDLPVLSGLAQLKTPARMLTVGLSSQMPPAFVADGRPMEAAVITLGNPAPAGAGAIRIDHLVLRAADRSFAPLAVGLAATRLEAWVHGAVWAVSAPLATDSTTAMLVASAPLDLAPGDTTQITLRIVTRGNGGPTGYRLGIDQSGLGVVQPTSALLAVNVQPGPGQQFPMWSDASGLTGLTLRDSYSNFPNPFAAGREGTAFVYYLRAGAHVSIHIMTPFGDNVATLLDNAPRVVGLHQDDQWTGRNGQGQAVYNGVYVAELVVHYDDGSSERVMRKLAVIR